LQVVLAGDGQLRVPLALLLRMRFLRWRSWLPAGKNALARLRSYQGYMHMLNQS
jgi:hypothetical protein